MSLSSSRPVTSAYHSAPSAALRVDELPPFRLATAELMTYDPQVRIGLGARNGLLMGAEVEIVGDDRPIVDWVREQWERLWCGCSYSLLRAKLYGFLPFEVMYRRARGGRWDGLLEVERLLDRHPRDARLLTREGQIVGYRLDMPAAAPIELLAPKALVCTFDSSSQSPYGCALLERAYPAWYEKWMEGGVKKTLRLRMVKDAFLGDILWHPADRKATLPNGTEVSWSEIARELVAARTSGGALTLPLVYDRDGRKLLDYTPPQDLGGATQIFSWKKDIDQEIWKALEVPPEVIEATSPGSGYAGRTIPFIVALSAVQYELAELIRCLDRDIFRPIAQLNFGRQPHYDLRPRSLVDTYFARLESGPQFQRPPSQ